MNPAATIRLYVGSAMHLAPGLQADLDHAKKLSAAKDRDALRAKEALARDIARASVRCKEQMAKGNLATNDC